MPPFLGAIAACRLALALASPPDHDETTPASAWTLEWSAPPSCPDPAAVRTRVEALLPGTRPSATGLVVRATVEGRADRWSLELSVDDAWGGGARRMRARDCKTLVEVTALVVAIELDALAASAALPVAEVPEPPTTAPVPAAAPPGEPKVDPPRPSAAAPAETAEPTAPSSRARGPGLAMGLHAGVGVGVLPSPSALLGGAVTIAWPRLRLMVLGESWPRQRIHYPDEAVGASLGLGAAGLRVCPVLHPGRLEVPLCAGAWAGGQRGEGLGVEAPRRVIDTWFAVELEPSLGYAPLPMLALRLGVAGLLSVRRPGYALGDRPELFRTGPFAARITFSLELRLRGERFRP